MANIKDIQRFNYPTVRLSVLEDIKAEIKELFKTPARYMPNYDAYSQCLEIIDKHISAEESEGINNEH